MVLGQLVFFDRDPSLWLIHVTPKASRGFADPALLALGMALVLVGLATVGFFTSNRPRDTKYDRKGHANISMSFNILARVTIFAALSYFIYTTMSGLLVCISTTPIRTPAKPTPLYMSLANRLLNSTTTLLVKFGVLDQRVLPPCQASANDSPLPLGLAASAQKFVSWLLANDRLSMYYPILMVVSMCHKVVLSYLRSATGAGPSLCITHKAVLLVLTLGFTASVRSVAVLTRVPALNQAALVASGLATTLGLDILVSLPSLAFWCAHGESKWQTATEYAIGATTLEFFFCYAKDFHNLRSHANILIGTGELDMITMQAVAFGVLLFPCLVAFQLHSTVNIVGFLHSQSTTFISAAMQSSDSQPSIGKEQPVVTLTSTDTAEGAPISQTSAEENSQSTRTPRPTLKSRSDYGTIIRTHPSALYWKLANVYAWISSPNLHYRSIDGWEYTFNDSDLFDVYLLMAKAYKRVLDEILASVPTIFDPRTVETLVVKYMQEARKQLLQSHVNASSGRGINHRRTEYRHRQSFKRHGATSVSTPPSSPSNSDSSDYSEPTTPDEEAREAAVQLKAGSRSLGSKLKSAMAKPVNRQIQVQFGQMKYTTDLAPVVELDEENATEA